MKVPIRNDFTEIERLAHIVEDYCKRNSVSDKMLYPLNLVLDEMVTNVISYVWDDNTPHEFYVYLEIRGDMFIAKVEDDGKAFNPLEKEEVDTTRSVEEKPIGGWEFTLPGSFLTGLNIRGKQIRIS